MARAGGRDPEKLGDALAKAEEACAGRSREGGCSRFGSARTGVAVWDPTGTIAPPLGVVERAATDDGLAPVG